MRRPRSVLVGVALAGSAALLAGCGFTPLYATQGVTGGLRGVAVETPEHSRTGYLLREQLADEMGTAPGKPPAYRLQLGIDEQRYPRGVRVNNVANRYEIDLNVRYTLSDIATGRVLTNGQANVEVSYASSDPPYAGVAAEQDGEERAAGQAAVRIRLELARWLAAQAPESLPQPQSEQPAQPAQGGQPGLGVPGVERPQSVGGAQGVPSGPTARLDLRPAERLTGAA